MSDYTKSLSTIFSEKIFKVPDYQRGYAWEEQQCRDLLDDLELLPDGFEHYTGTLVFHKVKDFAEEDDAGNSYTLYDIVDGQQRLTSLVILLSAIQKEFKSNPDYASLAEGIQKKYLHTKRLSDGNSIFKLTLNEDNKEFFKKDILGESGVEGQTIKSHERLADASMVFSEYLTTKKTDLGNGFFPWLQKLHSKITNQLKMGMYMVTSEAEVGVIFEVMNNRGKELTELEKVKNYLLYLTTKIDLNTTHKLVKKINKTWSNLYRRFMSAELGSGAENQFLRAHWMMYADYKRRNWKGSKSIKEKFSLKSYRNKQADLYNELLRFVGSLDDSSIAFADLEKPKREEAFNAFVNQEEKMRVIYWSEKLVRTRTIATFRPLLMALRLKHPTDSKTYLELVTLMEKFAFRVYNMQGKRADTGQSTIFKHAYDLYNDTLEASEVLQKLKRLLNFYSKASAFNAYWEFDEENNNWYTTGLIKYLLYEYEDHLSTGRGVHYSWEKVTNKKLEDTIEHIYPQNPDPKDAYWAERFDHEDAKLYLHDLGNLCLTNDNSSYRNFDFNRKKGESGQDRRCYANSMFFQERELVNYPEWTPESIKERREKIIRWAKERWYVPPVELKESDELEVIEEENESDIADDPDITESTEG